MRKKKTDPLGKATFFRLAKHVHWKQRRGPFWSRKACEGGRKRAPPPPIGQAALLHLVASPVPPAPTHCGSMRKRPRNPESPPAAHCAKHHQADAGRACVGAGPTLQPLVAAVALAGNPVPAKQKGCPQAEVRPR